MCKRYTKKSILRLGLSLALLATALFCLGPALAGPAKTAGQSKASQARELAAMLDLAGRYLAGEGMTRDFAKALAIYKKAAAMGSTRAELALGGMYENGNGVPRNFKTAYAWYLRAAKAGDAEGQWEVGRCHYDGLGVDPSINQAMQWWAKAADQGHSRALFAVLHGYPWYEDAE